MSSFTELVVSECNGGSERSEANGCGCGANNNHGGRLYKLSQPFTYAIGRKGAGAILMYLLILLRILKAFPSF